MQGGRRKFLQVAGLGGAGVMLGAGAVRAIGESKVKGPALGGKRWALVVDTRKCAARQGCKACSSACHKAHNVPTIADPKHELKWIWPEPFKDVFPDEAHEFVAGELRERPVVVACNHCDNPPCTRVCPTKSTWKREDGVVMIDWHRCIGCRYCVVACPYGARSFNWTDPRLALTEQTPDFPTRTKGVPEKCNFCEERIAANPRNPLPACVEACRTAGKNALVFGDLADPSSEVRRVLADAKGALRRKAMLGTGPKVFYIV